MQKHINKMKKRSGFLKGFITGILIMVVVIVVFFGIVLGKNSISKSEGFDIENISKKLELINSMMDYYYIYDKDTDAMVDGIFEGFVSASGDKYAAYYNAEDYKALMESVSGVYKGIGVTVSQDEEGYIHIVGVFENTPAYESGLKTGDILYYVEETAVTGMDINKVVAMIKGEENSAVKLTLLRNNQSYEVSVERRAIEVPSVEYEMIDNEEKIGYIYISGFETAGVEQFNKAIDELKAEGMKKLVVDLRDNTGGELSAVSSMLDKILPEGLIVYMEDNTGKRTEKTSDAENYIDIPIVVVTNGYTASASEIFAGALQDYEMATIVGTKTYGKGVVQSIYEVGDGSYLKVTMAKYYTPDGRSIDGVGIEPDILIEYDDTNGNDNQLEKALEVIKAK